MRVSCLRVENEGRECWSAEHIGGGTVGHRSQKGNFSRLTESRSKFKKVSTSRDRRIFKEYVIGMFLLSGIDFLKSRFFCEERHLMSMFKGEKSVC